MMTVTKCGLGQKFVPATNDNPFTAKCEICAEGTYNFNQDASTQCSTKGKGRSNGKGKINGYG